MPFDLSTAKPVESGFDLSTAKPVILPTTSHFVGDQPTDITQDMSKPQLFAAGAGKSVVDTGRGVGQLARNVIETTNTMGDMGGNKDHSFSDALGLPTQADVDEAAKNDKPLMKTGAGLTGNMAGQALQFLVPGSVLGKVGAVKNAATALEAARGGSLVLPTAGSAAFGAAQPVVTGDSRLRNAAEAGLAGAVGQGGVNTLKMAGKAVASNIADKTLAASQNTTKDATQAAAVDSGYVLPPGYAGGGTVAKVGAGLSGKAKLDQAAIIKNQSTTNQLARDYLELPKTTSLNDEVLAQQRNDLAAPYRDAADLPKGVVGQTQTRSQGTGNIVTTPIEYDGKTLVDEIKATRFDSKSNWDSFKRTGNVDNQKAAQALDSKADDLEQKLISLAKQNGDDTLAQRLSDARVKLAKNYQVDRALNSDTGDVDARVFARAKNKGQLISGEGAKIASFANAYGDVARPPKSGDALPVTAVDGFLAALNGSRNTASALAAPIPATARVLIRNALLSPKVQQAMANKDYGVGPTQKLLNSLLSDESLSRPAVGNAKYAAPVISNTLRQDSP